MSYFQPEDGRKYYLFGKDGGKNLSEQWNIDLLGTIPIEEDKSFSNMQKSYIPIVGKLVQKLSIIAANKEK